MTHNKTVNLGLSKRRRGAATFQAVVVAIGFLLGVGCASLIVVRNLPVPPQDPSRTAAVAPQTSDDLAAEKQRLQSEVARERLEHEVAQLRSELRDLRSGPTSDATADDHSPTRSRTAPPRISARSVSNTGEATLRYWKSMNRVIRQEASMRRAPLSGITAGNVNSYLASRHRAYRFAADELGRLNTSNVDPLASAVAKDVRDWYLAGLDVTSRANSLVQSDVIERRGATGQMWQNDEKSHNASVQGVNERAEVARRMLESKYDLAFPVLE